MASPAAYSLVGVWELTHSDDGLGLAPGSLMVFLPSGELRYASPRADGGAEVALLTYRVDGEWIVSNQASAPREERTHFALPAPDRLELTYAGGRATFRRAR